MGTFLPLAISLFSVSAVYKHAFDRRQIALCKQFSDVGGGLFWGAHIYRIQYRNQTKDNKRMALEGSLADFGLADILQLIYFQRKTGVLTLEGKMDKVRLLFIEGNIGGAESKRRMEDNRLGKILLKKEYILEKDLEAALEEQRKTGDKLGNILIRNDLVEKEIIKDIVQAQITETIIQLFGWKQGTYEFTTQGVQHDRDLPFSLDTQHLLMEGLRIVDEWSVIQGRISVDSLFKKRGDAPSGLTEEEEEVFAYVDGENDVSTIIDLCGKDNFEVSKTLLSLMEKGFIEQAEATPVPVKQLEASPKSSLRKLGFLPYLAVIVSFILSLEGVHISQGNADFRNFDVSRSVDEIRMKIEMFQIEHGTYPSTLEQITGTEDAWGRPYVYRSTADSFIVASTGADGIEGTADDIY